MPEEHRKDNPYESPRSLSKSSDTEGETEQGRHVHPLYWFLLLAPPLATFVLATAFYLLTFSGLGCVGVLFYLLTPLVCVVWSAQICWRQVKSSIVLRALLFVLELVLIYMAMVCTPRWD